MTCMLKVIYYCMQMCLKTLEISAMKYMNLIKYQVYFVSAPGLAWQTCLKKAGAKSELLANYDILLMVEKGIRGGLCHATHSYAKATNKYMKNYDKSFESSYLAFLDTNNLYGLAMSQKLPVNGFKWVKNLSKFNEDFIKILMKIVIKDIFLK